MGASWSAARPAVGPVSPRVHALERSAGGLTLTQTWSLFPLPCPRPPSGLPVPPACSLCLPGGQPAGAPSPTRAGGRLRKAKRATLAWGFPASPPSQGTVHTPCRPCLVSPPVVPAPQFPGLGLRCPVHPGAPRVPVHRAQSPAPSRLLAPSCLLLGLPLSAGLAPLSQMGG